MVCFGSDPARAYEAAAGPNVQYTLTPGRRLPGLPGPVLGALVRRKDSRDREGAHNWFSLTRKVDLRSAGLPLDIDGLRIAESSRR